MTMRLQLGLEVIQSYKRLAYTPWHAIAEFVDNATQSYFDNRSQLDAAFAATNGKLTIGIVYDREKGMLRVSDNAMGMSSDELSQALIVGHPPVNTSGRSKYGMGMKTAACWLGNFWTVRTKKLGDSKEVSVSVDVDKVASGTNELPHHFVEADLGIHYTVLEVTNLNKTFQGRTIGKITDFLRSMYRQDLRNGSVSIEWQGTPLAWSDADYRFLVAPDGVPYRRKFQFEVGAKPVWGWVGILERGSRARAGFSIFHSERVVRGWPDSWRPESIYGQIQGSNDLVNQRLIGEIHLDAFDVSHTKDDILWIGDEEDTLQDKLKTVCTDFASIARSHRGSSGNGSGPSQAEVRAAMDELEEELKSPEIQDKVRLEAVTPPEVAQKAMEPIIKAVEGRQPDFSVNVGGVEVFGYLMSDGSANDPYVVVDSTQPSRVMVSVNQLHPHWNELRGSEGVLNYWRHCVYDAISEWKARSQSAPLHPDTIKLFKDGLLRFPINLQPTLE